ncbi:MAG: hypothetical protein HON72_05825 [Porticoccaceae bacterium]|jgi:hypothetical protein|nr:hypothetical protein [Porticoccaceae bacterium]MDB2534091.1 hypothetical protein [Porticoccaceae bacterium]MDG1486463.1 hypothetical protein [Porticoccaceae bacterium]
MGDDLDELNVDGDIGESAVTEEPSLTDKQQAQVKLESRRRLELKLEDARIQKQVQEYDFDDDFD